MTTIVEEMIDTGKWCDDCHQYTNICECTDCPDGICQYKYVCERCDKPLREEEAVSLYEKDDPYCQDCADYLNDMGDYYAELQEDQATGN